MTVGAGVVYGAAALGVATGVCVQACGQLMDNINHTASNIWNGIFHNDNAGSRPGDGLPAKDGSTVVRPGETGRKDEISHKPGTAEDAHNDFDKSLKPGSDVKDIGNGGRTGTASNGNNITVRPDTKSGPTVEVTRGNGQTRDTDKIRYKDPKENQ